MTVPDFTALTAAQFAVILTAIALLDFATGVIGALAGHAFSWDAVLQFLYTHMVLKAAPIALIFLVGQVAAIAVVCWAADGLLAAYFVQTAMSAYSNLSPAPAKIG